MHRFDVIAADLVQPDFLDNADGLADQRVLGRLDHFDLAVRPVDRGECCGFIDGATKDFGMLLMQRHVLGDLALNGKAADPGATGFDHLLADLQLLLGQAQKVSMRRRDLGRYRHCLRGRLSNRSGAAAAVFVAVSA